MLKFYMAPGSCSTGIHILLEELDLLFEVHPVNLLRGEHRTAEFQALNPKSSIPVLVRDDGQALTEFQAIAWWLARSHPCAGLLPDSLEEEVRVLEVMDYVVGTLHMQGFARLFTTERFCADEQHRAAVERQGREIIDAAFAVLDGQLAGWDYVAGRFGIADAALFYTEFWAERTGIALPERCATHYRTMLQRPAVRQVLMEEGYRLP